MKIKPIAYLQICLFACLISDIAEAQSTLGKFKRLSRPEKWWVMTHPLKARKALRTTQFVLLITDSIKKTGILGNDLNGGTLDAFKHSYWMACMTFNIGKKRAKKLGEAHEKGNRREFEKRKMEDGILPDSVSCAMDTWNNKQGLIIGMTSFKTYDNEFQLVTPVIRSIKAGEMRMIRKDEKGNYLDCSGKLIDLTAYKGQWGIPKCLISSQ